MTLLACLLLLVQMAWGAAYCPVYCPEYYSPVCGSDHKTYDNECELRQAACRDQSLYRLHEGSCELNKKCDKICFALYKPVCGTDGKNYSNSCFLGIEACKNPHLNLEIAHYGPCRPRRECPDVCIALYDPVCGSDGKTYGNSCNLGVTACKNPHLNLSIVHDGPCKPKKECPDVCIALYNPVCGSDGKTYSNSCNLGVTACKNPHLNLSIVHDGPCVN